MRHRLPILLIALWAALLAPSAGFAADPVFPVGSRIGLVPPGDLKLSRHFIGFEDPDRKVTISILQVPVTAHEDIERSVFAKNQTGLTEVKRESFGFENGIGFLLVGNGEQDGVKIRKWFLTATGFGPQFIDLAMLIKVDVPDSAGAVYSDAVIRAALASVTFRLAPIEEQLTTVPFKLTELAGFRVMRVVPNEGVILIDGPESDMIKQPYLILSRSRGDPESPDARARFARELITSAPLRDITVTLAEPMRIDGRPGYEVRASATGFDGKPLALVQWLRFSGGGFVRIIGAVPKDNWNQFFPRFRAVRDGIDLD
jgi:hypothetical protein